MHPSIKAKYRFCFIFLILLIKTIAVPLQAQEGSSISSEIPGGEKADSATSGVLFDELAQLDNLIFTAAFVTCDAKKIDALMTEDVEFYHDLTGFSAGQQVRDNNVNLTKNCPGRRGISRQLVKGSLRVYPIKDYGAIQMGTHVFVEENAPTRTVAKFVHLWKKENEGKKEEKEAGGKRADTKWKISRVLSFDHVSFESVAGVLPQLVE